MKERNDDYSKRRQKIKAMSDSELKKYFYKLSDQIVDPLVEMGYEYTSKSIERSVLLRMGFSSIEAKAIVDKLGEYDLLKKGAGHCVYKLSKEKKLSIQEAGVEITEKEGIDFLKEAFHYETS